METISMTDIHTHILPGADDGAADIYETVEMARLAFETGTEVIVATPHCNIPGEAPNYFGEEYLELFQQTKKTLEREVPGLRLLAGMEVFATEDVPGLLAEGRICPINGSRYVLMEFDFEEEPDYACYILERVKEVRAKPVIAHAERYEFVQDDPDIIKYWLREGYEIQINKGSVMGRFGSRARHTAFRLLEDKLVTAVASDAHGPHMRTTCLADAYDALMSRFPREYLDVLFRTNPLHICKGEPVWHFRR